MRTRTRQALAVSGETGLAIVEMAFIFPIFLLLTIGLVEFSRAWLTVNTMNHATREALRLAATTAGLTADDATVISKATTILANANVPVSGVTVTNTAPAGTPSEVTVTTIVAFRYLGVTGTILGFSFGGPITLTSQATMHYER
ncbi:MAG TPA: TadE/TadG family type IV pilus assembly protein [Anaerolineales bacterium]|nr:TadE/TadG family type IV pilus assembly protein [Anaerolineales bacterium]